jgi:glutathione S-transferase
LFRLALIILSSRFALNIKGVSYTTVFVEYPDIEGRLKADSVPSNGTKADSAPFYTLPALVDPNTGAKIADSQNIAEYLDKQYPAAGVPVFFPPGSRTLQVCTFSTDSPEQQLNRPSQLGFRSAFQERVRSFIRKVITQPIAVALNPVSAEYWTRTRSERDGGPIEDVAPVGSEKRAGLVRDVLKGLHAVAGFFDGGEAGGPFAMGAEPCFADLDIASTFVWAQTVDGEGEGSLWADIAKADGGRWARYLEAFDKWRTVH